jgi:hypothetical protein
MPAADARRAAAVACPPPFVAAGCSGITLAGHGTPHRAVGLFRLALRRPAGPHRTDVDLPRLEFRPVRGANGGNFSSAIRNVSAWPHWSLRAGIQISSRLTRNEIGGSRTADAPTVAAPATPRAIGTLQAGLSSRSRKPTSKTFVRPRERCRPDPIRGAFGPHRLPGGAPSQDRK